MRGVGVHHAGVLPKYRRVVEELFQRKLLSITTCTETLSAGINLPARSVVVPSIMKGPPDKKKLLDPSTAHQIFGRAGRPQFDKEGHVYVLAHEDDVKIARWREKYDQIPEDTKDPGLMKAKKALKKKMPTRRSGEQYWNEAQFNKLCAAPPGNLYSRGPLPWRLLAYMLDASPEVDIIRRLVGKRLMDPGRIEAGQRELDRALMTLWRTGYVTLEPQPPSEAELAAIQAAAAEEKAKAAARLEFTFGFSEKSKPTANEPPPYKPVLARPTENMAKLLLFRGVNPLYAVFLINQLGIADRNERIQAMESVLELPRSVGHFVRVPRQDEMPPGPLATLRLDAQLLQLGLATAEELSPHARTEESQEDRDRRRLEDDGERKWILTVADKLRRLFDYEYAGVHDLRTSPVWAAGELLQFGGDFNKYVTSKSLQKQEGLVFRHALRLILLIGEFMQLSPPEALMTLADRLCDAGTATADGSRTGRHSGRGGRGEGQRRPRSDFTFGFGDKPKPTINEPPPYKPVLARPTENMAKLLLFRGMISSISWASPTATSGFRRWRAFWNCRDRWAILSACRGRTKCRPARWRRCGLTGILAARPGHAGRTFAERPGGRDARGPRPSPLRGRRRTEVDIDAGRQAPPAIRLRVHRRARSADLAGVGGGRAAAIRRRLQQVCHRQEPAKAGGLGLPPRVRLILLIAELMQLSPPEITARNGAAS